MTSRYAQEVQAIDELLKQRDMIHSSYSMVPPLKRSSSNSKIRVSLKESAGNEIRRGRDKEKKPATRDRPRKKKWYNIHLKVVDRKKPC
ncbi:hypothetical protein ACLOJK_004110 [Asimina triloba]